MTMPLPDETIRLGEDIRAEKPGALYPEALAEITEPELIEVLERYGADWSHSPNPVKRLFAGYRGLFRRRPIIVGTAATNWGVFEQRMRLILALFRTRQRCEELRGDPFTDAQLNDLLAGEMPQGPL